MQKKLSKEIKTYCRAIKKALICPHSLKCAFMADIKSQILDYVEEIGVDSINIQDIKYRFGTPEDIAKAIVYLADAPFVTGQVLGVSGGLIY